MVKRKTEGSKEGRLVQTTIFNAFQTWKDMSINQKLHMNYQKQRVESGIVIDLSDELSDNEAKQMKFGEGRKVKRELAFPMSDSEDDEYRESLRNNPSPKKIPKHFDVVERKFTFTPLKSNRDDRNTIISDASSQTREVNSVTNSDSLTNIPDGENHNVSNVVVSQHIIIRTKSNGIEISEDVSPKKVVPTEEDIPTEVTKPSLSKENILGPKLDESSINTKSSPKKGSSLTTSPAINRTPTKSFPKKGSSLTTSPPINRTPTKNKPSKAVASPSNSKSPKKLKKRINTDYLKLMTNLFLSVYESPYSKNIIKEETKILKEFILADTEYQYVCLKLSTWKPRWYNRHKFCDKINVDMGDHEVVEMYNFLAEKGIVETDYSKESLEDLLNLLDANDIKSVCNKFKLNKRVTKKEDMIQLILMYTRTQSTLTFTKSTKDIIFTEVSKKLGSCFKLKESFRDAFKKVYILGTFANPSFEDIWDFSKTMLNSNISFPEFAVENYVVFYSKDEFNRYVEARKYRDDLNNAKLLKNHVEMLRTSEEIFKRIKELAKQPEDNDRYKNAPHLRRFSDKSIYIGTLSKVVKDLQAKFPEVVSEWLEFLIENVESPRWIGDWYYHLTWLYMRHLKPINYEHAAELLIKVLKENNDVLTERQKYFLSERGEQLKHSKKYKIDQLYHDHITELLPEPIDIEVFPTEVVDAKTLRSNESTKKRMYVAQDSKGQKTFMSVENIALDFYKKERGYTDGRHCEGSLLKAMFTLCFWDIIYNPETVVPGTFLLKMQEVPLDMLTPYFYQNRKQAIDKRLKDIGSDWTDDEVIEFAKDKWNLYSHERGFCVAGTYIENKEILVNLISCIERKILSKIFERMVRNVRHNCSGMPDLLIWNVDNKKSKFVEVKGEGDHLSVTQKLWIKYLLSIGANAEICHVHSMGSKRKFAKSEGSFSSKE